MVLLNTFCCHFKLSIGGFLVGAIGGFVSMVIVIITFLLLTDGSQDRGKHLTIEKFSKSLYIELIFVIDISF